MSYVSVLRFLISYCDFVFDAILFVVDSLAVILMAIPRIAIPHHDLSCLILMAVPRHQLSRCDPPSSSTLWLGSVLIITIAQQIRKQKTTPVHQRETVLSPRNGDWV